MTKYPIEKGDYLVVQRPTWAAVFRVGAANPGRIYFDATGRFTAGDVAVMWFPREVYCNLDGVLRKKYPSIAGVLTALESHRRLSAKEICKAYEVRIARVGMELDVKG